MQPLDMSLDQLVEHAKRTDGGGRGGGFRGKGRGRAGRFLNKTPEAYVGSEGGRVQKRQRDDTGVEILVGRKIYVGNLSYDTSWQALKDHFRSAGNVLYANVIQDANGRSKGCATLEFEYAEEAAAAISTLHDSELDGRPLFVREDREDLGPIADRHGGRWPKQQRGDGYSKSVGSAVTVGRRVFVNGLSSETSWQGLKDHAKSVGPVAYAEVFTTAEGESQCCGIVEFERPADAVRAIGKLTDSVLDGSQIYVREDRSESSSGGHGGMSRGLHQAGPRLNGAAGTQIIVHGLPWSMQWQDLKDLMAEAGGVVRADVVQGADGRSKGWGKVLFSSPEDAANALAMFNGYEFSGRILSAKHDEYVL